MSVEPGISRRSISCRRRPEAVPSISRSLPKPCASLEYPVPSYVFIVEDSKSHTRRRSSLGCWRRISNSNTLVLHRRANHRAVDLAEASSMIFTVWYGPCGEPDSHRQTATDRQPQTDETAITCCSASPARHRVSCGRAGAEQGCSVEDVVVQIPNS